LSARSWLIVNPTTEERGASPAGGDTAAEVRQRRGQSCHSAGWGRASLRGVSTESDWFG
jgi:hypothetical protein